MTSDYAITVANHTIELTYHDAVVIGLGILIALAFWAVLHFSRRRVIHIEHSDATNQIMLELSRIAVALQDIANRPADQIIASATRREIEPEPDRATRREPERIPAEQIPVPEQERQPRGMPYSLFGR
jgi:hypothetical protein